MLRQKKCLRENKNIFTMTKESKPKRLEGDIKTPLKLQIMDQKKELCITFTQ
jgi:hypothetical protein